MRQLTTRRRHFDHRLNRRNMLRGAAGTAVAAGAATQLGRFSSALGAPARQSSAEPQGEGVTMADQLGREYLVYPETTGTVEFSNCWGGARIPLIDDTD